MKLDDIANYTKRCGSELVKFINEKTPEMEASHAWANFLTLPAELWNRVYELVLAAADGIELEDGTFMIEIGEYNECISDLEFEGMGPSYISTPFWCKQPPLTRVSRQVRAETLPVYYGSNTFAIYILDVGSLPESDAVAALSLQHGETWLKSMTSANRILLKHLHIRFCPNASQVGLSRTRMTNFLDNFGMGVSENAISTWINPFAECTGPGELSDWVDVSVSTKAREKSQEDNVERGLREKPSAW